MNSNKNKRSNCYYCGKQATSDEHVPPKCLFPEQKDVFDIFKKDYRINLITVPSCEDHNSKKSGDDEYLLACLAGILGNNSIAFVHNSTKIRRALERNDKLIDAEYSHTIEIEEKKFPISILKSDNKRLVRSFEAIAKGIYFHENQKIYSGDFNTISSIFNNTKDEKWNSFNRKSVALLTKERQLWNTKVKGNNPEIFTFQFSPKDQFGSQTLALNFYENTVVFVILSNLKDEVKKLRNKIFKKPNDILFLLDKKS